MQKKIKKKTKIVVNYDMKIVAFFYILLKALQGMTW